MSAVTTSIVKKTKESVDAPIHVEGSYWSKAANAYVDDEGLGDGVSADIPNSARFDVTFDRYLSPEEAIRRSVCLRASLDIPASSAACTDGLPLKVSYDPIRRVVSYYLDADQVGVLDIGVRYTLTVFTASGSGEGFRAFDGRPLDANHSFSFETIDAAALGPEQPIEGGGYCAADPDLCYLGCDGGVEEVFRNYCGDACHVDTKTSRGMEAPSLGLQLHDLFGIENTAKDRVAHETEIGGRADAPALSPAKLGAGMPIVASHDAGNSYMLYKVLANVPDGWDPPLEDGTPAPSTLADGETERLRASLVVGMPMPALPYTLDYAGAERISKWIASGAEIPDCARTLKQ